MDTTIEFRPISWEDLQKFLVNESRKINRDVDHDVRYMTYSFFCEQVVEGLYLNGVLVGFARWNSRLNHLSNLYVAQEYRRKGVAKKYLQERNFESLYVMPHNHIAKSLYESQGFTAQKCAVPSREFMSRNVKAA